MTIFESSVRYTEKLDQISKPANKGNNTYYGSTTYCALLVRQHATDVRTTWGTEYKRSTISAYNIYLMWSKYIHHSTFCDEAHFRLHYNFWKYRKIFLSLPQVLSKKIAIFSLTNLIRIGWHGWNVVTLDVYTCIEIGFLNPIFRTSSIVALNVLLSFCIIYQDWSMETKNECNLT